MKKIIISIIITLFTVTSFVACSKTTTQEKEVLNALNSIKNQDCDTIDKYFPETGLGSFVYNDPEGFNMYCKKLTWNIEDVIEKDSKTIVKVKATNVDMSSILDKNPPNVDEMMPNPTMDQIDKAPTRDFNIDIVLKKDKDSHVIEGSSNLIKDILNIVTGGGTDYLEAYNENHSK